MKNNLFSQKRTIRLLFAILITCLPLSIWQCQNSYKNEEANEENETDAGEAEKLEFLKTRNPFTNTIPENGLLNAFEEVQRAEQTKSVQMRSTLPTWVERGPYSDVVGSSNGNTRPGANTITSGRSLATWVDLRDNTGKTVFMGGVSGGIWKTTDITATNPNWAPVDDLMSNLSISSICQNPVNKEIFYCATGYPYGNGGSVRGVGVFRSTDGGVSWSLLNSTTSFTTNTKIVCDAAGNVYLGTMGSGLRRSNDNGDTWTTITPTSLSSRVTDIEISSTGRMHFTTGFGNTTLGGYRYTDNPSTVTSATWTTPTTNFSFPSGARVRCEMACVGNTVYVAAVNPTNNKIETLFKSIDGGDTWSSSSIAAAILTSLNGTGTSGQAWFCFGFAVDPSNADNLVLGNLNCIKSTDGGTTWTKISEWVGTTGQYVHADILSVNWYDNGNKMIAATDGGLFYSADKGSTFIDRNLNLRLKMFYSGAMHPSSTNHILAGAQDNGNHLLTDAGLSTSVEVTGGDGAFVGIDQSSPQYQFGAYTYNVYRRSTNTGATWSSVTHSSTEGVFINPWDYDNTNAKIYASTTAGSYVRWDNPRTGNTFVTQAITELNSSLIGSVKVSPYTSNTVYFGTQAGRIVKVDDAHTATPTATNLTSASMPAGYAICINTGTNDQNLIMCFSNYGITNVWVSNNGGTTWTGIDGNLPDMPVRWAMFKPNENNKAYIATEMGVYETTNINGSSTTWTRHDMPAVRTQMLTYRSSDNTLLAATHGRGMWSTTLTDIALPITMTDFVAYEKNNTAVLNWATANEQNNVGYEVEKSSDGKQFKNIGFVKGAGTTNQSSNYTYVDKTPLANIQYYRLKQLDYNGAFTYSKIVSITSKGLGLNIVSLTNPFKNDLQIWLTQTPERPLQIELFDLNGRLVFSSTKQNCTDNQIVIPISPTVNAGVYMARITVGNQQMVRKVMKM